MSTKSPKAVELPATRSSLRRMVGRLSEAEIRARWRWDKGFKATRQNIRLAIRRTGNPYGITCRAIPYLAPVVGMRVKTDARELGNIIAIGKAMTRGGDPEVKINTGASRIIYLHQTALNGYRPVPPND